MNIFVTGADGFIGKNISDYFENKGFNVYGSVSKKSKINSPKIKVITLNEEFDELIFDKIDVLIHCAFDNKPNSYEKNINGTKLIAETADRNGVKRQIFISSYSSFEAAISEYGKAKFQLEKFFKGKNKLIVRPGLVIGNGGLFERMTRVIKRFPIIPLIGGGEIPFPVITINDLIDCINQILVEDVVGTEFNLFYTEFTNLKSVINIITRLEKCKRLLISIPTWMFIPPLWLAEKIKISLPINLENLKGYSNNMKSPHLSNLDLFSVHNNELYTKVKDLLSNTI